MRTRLPFALVALGLLLALPAHALKVKEAVTPQSMREQGFTFSATRKEDGMLSVRITRDPAKARWTGRSAHLEVRGESGILAKCEPVGETKNKLVTYRFDLSPESFRHSFFTVAEIQTGPSNEILIGGGTYYEFRLADFGSVAKLDQ